LNQGFDVVLGFAYHPVAGTVTGIVALSVFLLPTICCRKKRNNVAIATLNLLVLFMGLAALLAQSQVLWSLNLGLNGYLLVVGTELCSVIGWIVAMVWAMVGDS